MTGVGGVRLYAVGPTGQYGPMNASENPRWSPRQITTMVVAICCAVVLAPLGAIAATGNLVNITDPVHAARKARVDANGRLTVSDRGPVTANLLTVKNLACGGSFKDYVLDTTGYASIRVTAYNPGPSQAILHVGSNAAYNGIGTLPNIWEHTMPHSTQTSVTHEITTPPAHTRLRVHFCSEGFRIFVSGSR